MKKKKALKKLLVKIEMQNRKMLMDIEFIRQNISVSIPFVTTTDTTTPQECFPNWKCLGTEVDTTTPSKVWQTRNYFSLPVAEVLP